MTQLELFANIPLPLGIAAVGGLIAYLYVRADKRHHGQHPAEQVAEQKAEARRAKRKPEASRKDAKPAA